MPFIPWYEEPEISRNPGGAEDEELTEDDLEYEDDDRWLFPEG